MPTRNINLTEHLDRFIDRRVASGQYGNASEVVREGLRLVEERQKEQQAKLRALRKAAKVGLDSIDQGEGIVLRNAEEIDAFMEEIAAEIKAARSSKGKPRA